MDASKVTELHPFASKHWAENVKSKMTDEDHKLARVLFAIERHDDAARGLTDRLAAPPLHQVMAFNLRNMTNREMLRDLLEDKPPK